MALANLTRQLAAQAIGDKVNDLVDSLRPPDLAKISEQARTEKLPAPAVDSLGAVMIGQIQAMQKALKEDQELVVLCCSGIETLRVVEIYSPSWGVLVVTGIDAGHNVTRIVSAAQSLQLVCKVMKARPDAKPVRVNVIVPKPRPD